MSPGFFQLPIPGAIQNGFVNAEHATALRAQTDACVRGFDVADEGRFAWAPAQLDPALTMRITQAAERICGQALSVHRALFYRYGPGDYALTRFDRAQRLDVPLYFEATVDLSEASSDEGQVTYTNGEHVFVGPQRAGALFVVQRTPRVYRWDRYLGCRAGGQVVYRLRLALTP